MFPFLSISIGSRRLTPRRALSRPFRATALLAALLVGGAACQKGGEDEAPATAASDSLTAPAQADSTASPSRSWKERLFGGEDEKPEEKPVPVETASVERRDIRAFLASTATLEPEKDATVLAKLSGQITRIRVEEGDWVEDGAVLAELDGAEQRVRLEEAAAGARGLELELERIRSLHERGLASDKQLHDAMAAFDQAEANRKAAELQVSYTQIRAPFAGQLAQRLVDPGQNVEAGRELFRLVDRTPLLASVHLPEREVAELAPGQELWIERTEGEAESDLPGSVLRIAPMVDTRTGTVRVTCQFEDRSSELRPGSFVRVKVQTGVHEDVLAVPKRALLPQGAETFVFRAEADSVVKVPVETGFADQEYVEIVAGLSAGERIVTVGHGALKTGARVEDLSLRAAPPAPAEEDEGAHRAATPESGSDDAAAETDGSNEEASAATETASHEG